MLWPFDIFKLEPDGQVLWLQAVGSLLEAEAQVEKLANEAGAKFIVLNQLTGMRYYFPPTATARSGGNSSGKGFSLPLSA